MTYFIKHASGETYSLSFAPRHMQDGATYITAAEYKRTRPAWCRQQLLAMVKPGDTVHTVLRHATASGMQRCISLFIIRDDEPVCIDTLAADLLGDKISSKHGGIVANGCGMDMGFHLVYSLGAMLWPDGTPEPHGTRNGAPDSHGGYALKHRWL